MIFSGKEEAGGGGSSSAKTRVSTMLLFWSFLLISMTYLCFAFSSRSSSPSVSPYISPVLVSRCLNQSTLGLSLFKWAVRGVMHLTGSTRKPNFSGYALDNCGREGKSIVALTNGNLTDDQVSQGSLGFVLGIGHNPCHGFGVLFSP